MLSGCMFFVCPINNNLYVIIIAIRVGSDAATQHLLLGEHNVRRSHSRMRPDKWKRCIIVYDLHKAEKLPYSVIERSSAMYGRTAFSMIQSAVPAQYRLSRSIELNTDKIIFAAGKRYRGNTGLRVAFV
jgi:hypothetical protein